MTAHQQALDDAAEDILNGEEPEFPFELTSEEQEYIDSFYED